MGIKKEATDKKIEYDEKQLWTSDLTPNEEISKEEYEEYLKGCEEEQMDCMTYEEWYEGFAEDYYEATKEYAENILDEEIIPMIESQLYEDTLILYGNVGMWHGPHDGGNIISIDDLKSLIYSYDYVKIYEMEKNQIGINFSHHDGAHFLKMYAFPKDKNKRLDLAKEMDYNQIIKEEYSDEEIAEVGADELILQDFENDIYYQNLNEESLFKFVDKLVPVIKTSKIQEARELKKEVEADRDDFLTQEERDTFNNLAEQENEESIVDLIENRIGQQISVGEFNTVMQSIFGKYNEVFLLLNELYSMDPNEIQEVTINNDGEYYEIMFKIHNMDEGIIEIVGLNII